MPAHRQKRLFDETREAEKVLQFLTNLGPGDLAQLILPTLLQAAHIRYDKNLLIEWPKNKVPFFHMIVYLKHFLKQTKMLKVS